MSEETRAMREAMKGLLLVLVSTELIWDPIATAADLRKAKGRAKVPGAAEILEEWAATLTRADDVPGGTPSGLN